jgi:hypothetical protein
MVTSAHLEAIDRWFSGDVDFAKLHRQPASTMIFVAMQDAVLARRNSLVPRRAIPHSEWVEVADREQKINAFPKGQGYSPRLP